MLTDVFADKSFRAVSELPLPAIRNIERHFKKVQQMALKDIAVSAQVLNVYFTDEAIEASKKLEYWNFQNHLASAIGIAMWMKNSPKYGADFSNNFVPELFSSLEVQIEKYNAFKKGSLVPAQSPQAEVASP